MFCLFRRRVWHSMQVRLPTEMGKICSSFFRWSLCIWMYLCGLPCLVWGVACLKVEPLLLLNLQREIPHSDFKAGCWFEAFAFRSCCLCSSLVVFQFCLGGGGCVAWSLACSISPPPWFFYKTAFSLRNLKLSVTDVSVQKLMKGAAKCDKHCELQNSVNQ